MISISSFMLTCQAASPQKREEPQWYVHRPYQLPSWKNRKIISLSQISQCPLIRSRNSLTTSQVWVAAVYRFHSNLRFHSRDRITPFPQSGARLPFVTDFLSSPALLYNVPITLRHEVFHRYFVAKSCLGKTSSRTPVSSRLRHEVLSGQIFFIKSRSIKTSSRSSVAKYFLVLQTSSRSTATDFVKK